MTKLNESMLFGRVTLDNFMHPDALRTCDQYSQMSPLTPSQIGRYVLARLRTQNHPNCNVLQEQILRIDANLTPFL